MKQFGYNGTYTLEVNRSCLSAKCLGKSINADKCTRIVIHFFWFWVENQICAKAFTQRTVSFKISWVCLQILIWSKLSRIYKIRNYYNIIFLAGTGNQACMSFMQKSHGRDKSDAFSLLLPFLYQLPCF